MSNAIGAGVSHITLVGSNQNNSPVWSEEAGKPSQSHAWAPYGHGDIDHPGLGFNGERIDPVSHTYHLGNGYRAYNPALMRFNCPDSLSPFGPGGINPYAYCAGDPINHTDPSGHISVSAGIGIGLGVVGILGGAFALFTGGASIGVAGAIAAAVGLAADGTGIASALTEESDPQASATLGWVSLGLGIASGMAGAGMAVGARIAKTRMIALEENLELAATANRRSEVAKQIKTNRSASLIERLNSQAQADLTEIENIVRHESDAKTILTTMNDLYSPENIIGYTKVDDALPTVYYKSGQLRGRITLDHPTYLGDGKSLPRKNVFFKNEYRRGVWRLHENFHFGSTILSHTSRGPFTPIAKISDSSFEELVRYTENNFPIKIREIADAVKFRYSMRDIV